MQFDVELLDAGYIRPLRYLGPARPPHEEPRWQGVGHPGACLPFLQTQVFLQPAQKVMNCWLRAGAARHRHMKHGTRP